MKNYTQNTNLKILNLTRVNYYPSNNTDLSKLSLFTNLYILYVNIL